MIRAAKRTDLPELLALIRAFHRHEGIRLSKVRRERTVARLIGDSSLGRLLVAEEETGLDGYVAVAYGYSIEFGGRDAFVDELFVKPKLRGAGLGTRLLDTAIDQAGRAGIVAFHLEVGTRNRRALALYQRRGFKEHDRHLMTLRI